MMLVFGVVGYLLKKCNYPLAPLVLAIVLGDKAEEAFRQSLLGSQGTLGVFFSNGLVSTIMVLGLDRAVLVHDPGRLYPFAHRCRLTRSGKHRLSGSDQAHRQPARSAPHNLPRKARSSHDERAFCVGTSTISGIPAALLAISADNPSAIQCAKAS